MSDITFGVGAELNRLNGQLQRATDTAEAQSRRMERAFGGLKAAVAGLIGSELVGQLRDFSQGVADYRNEIGDAATRTGLATETLAGLRLAAEASGQSFSELNPALVKLSKGGGDANVKLAEFVRTVREAKDPTEAAAFAAKTFGEEAGPKLLQAIGGTNEKLDAFVTFAERWGADVGPDAVEASARWQAATTGLDTAVKGLYDKMVPLQTQADLLVGGFLRLAALGVLTSASFVQIGDAATTLVSVMNRYNESVMLLPRALAGSADAQKQILENIKESTADVKAVLDGTAFSDAFTRGSVALSALEADLMRMLETAGSDGPGGGIPGIGESFENNVRPAIRMTLEDLQELFDKESVWREERAKINEEIAADESAMNARREEERLASLDRIRAAEEQLKQTMFGYFSATANEAIQAAATIAKARSKSARDAAVAERAAALFSIAINTARAIQAALATVQPTVPAGVTAAALVGAQGAIQAGAVLAQPLPKAHTGRTGTSRVGGSQGEVPVALTPPEAVLTGRAADNLGRGVIDALNKGMPVRSGPVEALVAWNGRLIDRVVSEVARADGELARLVSGGASLSMTTPFN